MVDVAVTPDDDEARRWLTDELAKAPYVESQPGPLERFWRVVLEWLTDALDGVRSLDSDVGVLLLGFAALTVIALAIWFIKPRLNAAARLPVDVFDGNKVLEASRHRALAAAAAVDAHYNEALTETLRAVIRSAEERTLIERAPGRTADEVSRLLGDCFQDRTDDIQWLVSRFNEVRYGAGRASAKDYEWARIVDQQLEKTQPHTQQSVSSVFAVPS
ncbi:DUF4129 domain-containing protein [Arthrobacter roseus]